MEQVLQNMNRLNRNLESIITVPPPRPFATRHWTQWLMMTRLAMNLALSRLFGHNLRISWVDLRKNSRKPVKGSGRSVGRVQDKAIPVVQLSKKEKEIQQLDNNRLQECCTDLEPIYLALITFRLWYHFLYLALFTYQEIRIEFFWSTNNLREHTISESQCIWNAKAVLVNSYQVT